ncbi:MAG: hypothetical protein FWH32_00555 [Clostridiales bacterium]|nr:hypothetical protein [Clostridiales bacterium]
MLTIDVQTALLCLLILAGIILAIYLIVAAYNLVKTLKRAQSVLNDLEVTAEITSRRAKELDKLIADSQKKLRATKGLFTTLPVIVKAATQIAKVVGNKKRG